jgi:hypothetical protein
MLKFQFYIISLWLLFPLVAIKEFKIVSDKWSLTFGGFWNVLKENYVPAACIILLFLGLYFYYRFTYKLKGSSDLPEEIVGIDDQNFEHLTFLTTYIIPFLRFKLEGRDLIITILLLVIIGAIFIKTNLFYKNPSLALLGYRLYKCSLKSGSSVIYISLSPLKKGDHVQPILLSDNIYFAKYEPSRTTSET